jgi:hypothetical protein
VIASSTMSGVIFPGNVLVKILSLCKDTIPALTKETKTVE